MSAKKTARQRAEELVIVSPYEPSDGDWWVRIVNARTSPPIIDGGVNLYDNRGDAEHDAEIYRKAIAAALALHAEEALRPPVSGGLSAERLAEIRRGCEMTDNAEALWKACVWIGDLLAHIDHLSAYLRVVANDDGIEAQDALYRRGWEDGKKACVDSLEAFINKHDTNNSWGDGLLSASEIVQSVESPSAPAASEVSSTRDATPP